MHKNITTQRAEESHESIVSTLQNIRTEAVACALFRIRIDNAIEKAEERGRGTLSFTLAALLLETRKHIKKLDNLTLRVKELTDAWGLISTHPNDKIDAEYHRALDGLYLSHAKRKTKAAELDLVKQLYDHSPLVDTHYMPDVKLSDADKKEIARDIEVFNSARSFPPGNFSIKYSLCLMERSAEAQKKSGNYIANTKIKQLSQACFIPT